MGGATFSRTLAAEHSERLLHAAALAEPIEPLTAAHPDLTIADAYEIQRIGRQRRLEAGARLAGHKVGLTSSAMQTMLGVHQPDFGYLLDSMVLKSGAAVSADALIQPRVEAEIAFYLDEPLTGPGVSRADVLGATGAVAPAIEIIDSRIRDWQITIGDTIADNASSAAAVVGEPVPLGDLDLAALGMTLEVGAEQVAGQGAAVLGHPAEAVAWLANALAEYGEQLEPGTVILPGAMARALPVRTGDTARATFDDLGLVTVSFHGGQDG